MFSFCRLLGVTETRKHGYSSKQRNKQAKRSSGSSRSAIRHTCTVSMSPFRTTQAGISGGPLCEYIKLLKSSLEMQKHFSAQVERFIMFNPSSSRLVSRACICMHFHGRVDIVVCAEKCTPPQPRLPVTPHHYLTPPPTPTLLFVNTLR